MIETGNIGGTRATAGSAVPTKSTTVGSRDVLTALFARVEAAEGPDRELDADIVVAAEGGEIVWLQTRYTGESYPAIRRARDWAHGGFSNDHCPHVTASLDAALALAERVLPGWAWEITRWTGGGVTTSLSQYNPGDQEFRASGPTPPLALLAALLKAKIAEAASPTG